MSHQVLQSFEVLSAEFMHSDIADEESRARSPRWAQPIFWASQRPFPWLGMVYTTHLPWFFGWLIFVYFPRYVYIYIIILYCIYIYIHICIYVYNIFFSVPPSLPARFRAKIWKHLTGMMVHRGKYPKITQHFRSVNCLPMISPFCIGSTRASHFPNAFHCLIVM